MLDRARWPNAHAYLTSLPAGLDSFPECTSHRTTYEVVRSTVLERNEGGPLPDALRRYLEEDGLETWSPEVQGVTAEIMLFDRMSEADALRWLYEDAARLFESPLLRALMRLMSPTLVVMGAGSRWGKLRKGSTLTTQPTRKDEDRNRTAATLTYPPGLYPDLFLRGLVEAFRAAIEVSHGKEPTAALLGVEPGVAHFEVSWMR